MSDVPYDIRMTASKLVLDLEIRIQRQEFQQPDGLNFGLELSRAIAGAINAERSRCADIAASWVQGERISSIIRYDLSQLPAGGTA